MILTYTKPSFKEDILAGVKIHTLREDIHDRWKPGRSIQHWLGNPRNIHSKVKPHELGTDVCKSVQQIKIINPSEYLNETKIYIDGKILSTEEMQQLAWNDGFENLAEFQKWFNKDFTGKIIHWTDKTY